jgi:hypothetical protein
VKATIEAPGALEVGRADGKGTVWVNVEDKSEIVRIDRARTPSPPTGRSSRARSHGLAFDPKTRRLFAGCNNKLLAVVNADTGAVSPPLPIGPGVDGPTSIPGRRPCFASCGGDGTLAVIKQESADKYRWWPTSPPRPRPRP